MGLADCAVKGCGRPLMKYGRGWCSAHYYRWKRHGDPLAGRTECGAPLKFIYEQAITHEGDDCLQWPFSRAKAGRGSVIFNGRTEYASRVVCELVHGKPSQPKLIAAHSCGNGHLGCVNPKHLRWATGQENMDDMVDHGRSLAGERNRSAKLSEIDVFDIRENIGKASQHELARRFQVTQSVISRIQSGQAWRSVS